MGRRKEKETKTRQTKRNDRRGGIEQKLLGKKRDKIN
jgi:hypothetical protein